MQPEPLMDLEHYGKLAEVAIAIAIFTYGVFRALGRPWVDQSRFESWMRKAPEAERFMREKMFKADLIEREHVRRMANRAIRVAKANATSINSLVETQRTATQLLASIPHLAASMENMATNMAKMEHALTETNKLCVGYGEDIATHAAILRERGATGLDDAERRHTARRATDAQHLPHFSTDESP